MARPKLKDGYTMIANETLEAISTINLSPYESRVLWCIVRKTYGWHKKADLISLSQIVKATGLAKGHASRALKHLLSRSLVTRLGNNQIGFQKDYEKWAQKLPDQVTQGKLPDQEPPVTRLGTPPRREKLPAQEPQKKDKDTLTKDNEAFTERQMWEKSIETLEHTTGLPVTIDLLRKTKTFSDWKSYLDKSANKVGILMEAFRSLHRTAPDMDWQNTGGRIAVLLTLANRDPGYLLRVIWETAPADIAGSHLNYIQGFLRSRQGKTAQARTLPTGDELKQSWGGDKP
jgi:phage replication O-like protein O